MSKNDDLMKNVVMGHCYFTVHNFWQEGDQLINEFDKVVQCKNLDSKTKEEVFAKFVVFLLDYCEVRGMKVLDKIFDSHLFENTGSI